MLFLFGVRLFPAVALAAFFVNYSIGAPLLAALAIAIGNTLEAVIAARLLQRIAFNPLFSRLRDALSIILVSIGAPFVSATIGVSALVLANTVPSEAAGVAWVSWWVGDMLGGLVIGTFLLKWLRRPLLPTRPQEIVEWIFIFLLTIVASFI